MVTDLLYFAYNIYESLGTSRTPVRVVIPMTAGWQRRRLPKTPAPHRRIASRAFYPASYRGVFLVSAVRSCCQWHSSQERKDRYRNILLTKYGTRGEFCMAEIKRNYHCGLCSSIVVT